MSDQKISALTELAEQPAATDELVIVDKSDTSMAASGTDKRITYANLIGTLYPIGSIYISTLSTNPGTLLRVGTWAVFGAGRTLVSLDSTDTDFDTVEETRGAKTSSVAHTHLVSVNTGNAPYSAVMGSGSGLASNADHAHTVSITSGAMSANATPSILQPYIVVYRWVRTA